MGKARRVRNMVVVLGDQLSARSAALDGFDRRTDVVWMAESQAVMPATWPSKLRLAFVLSAMRHFRDELLGRRFQVRYHELRPRTDLAPDKDFAESLRKDVKSLQPQKLIVLEPGDHALWTALERQADDLGLTVQVCADRDFYCSIEEFVEYGQDRPNLVMENFYRTMRRKHKVLLTRAGKPAGGSWNYDKLNRRPFGKGGPAVKRPRSFRPDTTTRTVISMVEKRFAKNPGSTKHFDIPVTRTDALALLKDFIGNRLENFGPYQDAMWTDEPFLYHSRLSAALNLHLLGPREVVEAAVKAYHAGGAPINSVEGFVRQVLGWREYVRGVYWLHMPDYAQMNELKHDRTLPAFFWDGGTDMECVSQAMRSVIQHGYAHHIQRLMVLGLFALLWGVQPRRFHDWHMAMYLDAVDWASLPNTIGMSQYADGGIVGTKPYCASGKYIDRMSNYCDRCRYQPQSASGDDACPFTVLYWDFLHRNRPRLRRNARMAFQLRNLQRKGSRQIKPILRHAELIRDRLDAGGVL